MQCIEEWWSKIKPRMSGQSDESTETVSMWIIPRQVLSQYQNDVKD